MRKWYKLNVAQQGADPPPTVFHMWYSSSGSARVLQGGRRNSKVKRDIRPLATPKPRNRSSPKVAYLIRSWISTHVQNLVMIPWGVSFPRMRKIAHQNVYSAFFGFFQPQTWSPNWFSRVIRQTTRFRTTMCLFGVRKQKFNMYTP